MARLQMYGQLEIVTDRGKMVVQFEASLITIQFTSLRDVHQLIRLREELPSCTWPTAAAVKFYSNSIFKNTLINIAFAIIKKYPW